MIILVMYLVIIISHFTHGCTWYTLYNTVCVPNYVQTGTGTLDQCATYCGYNYYSMYDTTNGLCSCADSCSQTEYSSNYDVWYTVCPQPTPYPTYPTPYPTYPTPYPTYPTPYPTYPTPRPTPRPTPKPTGRPTPQPTTPRPTPIPTPRPTGRPTFATFSPTKRPTNHPTRRPTVFPTQRPTPRPTQLPTTPPTGRSTHHPTIPTQSPTPIPTAMPSDAPSRSGEVIIDRGRYDADSDAECTFTGNPECRSRDDFDETRDAICCAQYIFGLSDVEGSEIVQDQDDVLMILTQVLIISIAGFAVDVLWLCCAATYWCRSDYKSDAEDIILPLSICSSVIDISCTFAIVGLIIHNGVKDTMAQLHENDCIVGFLFMWCKHGKDEATMSKGIHYFISIVIDLLLGGVNTFYFTLAAYNQW
eukprot:1151798_1